jgi:hypothetical protein
MLRDSLHPLKGDTHLHGWIVLEKKKKDGTLKIRYALCSQQKALLGVPQREVTLLGQAATKAT